MYNNMKSHARDVRDAGTCESHVSTGRHRGNDRSNNKTEWNGIKFCRSVKALDSIFCPDRFVFISEHTSSERQKSTMSATEYTPDTFKVILKKLVQSPEEFTAEDCAECFRHLCVQGASEAQVCL